MPFKTVLASTCTKNLTRLIPSERKLNLTSLHLFQRNFIQLNSKLTLLKFRKLKQVSPEHLKQYNSQFRFVAL